MLRTPVTHKVLRTAAKLLSLLALCAIVSPAKAQNEPVVCRDGTGTFEAKYHTGVSVAVAPARRDGFATRKCQGTLSWDKHTLVVAPTAAQVDIDAFGIDLDLGTPVITFQVRQNDEDCCTTLMIYSLQKPPKLLHTLTGAGFFRTADINLNGEVEIWGTDAAAMQNFESVRPGKPDLLPAVVLRFVRGRLIDDGSAFQNYFDSEIAKARSQLAPADLQNFKNSDGRVATTTYFSAEEKRQAEKLQQTKVRVLEIAWSYLNSGREQKAWTTLAEMWPTADLDRIKAEIQRAHAGGLLAQSEGAASGGRPTANTTKVFDLTTESAQSAPPPEYRGRRRIALPTLPPVTPPEPILIDRSAPEGEPDTDFPSEELLDLTIDAAGKVRTVRSADSTDDASLRSDSADWKFIPALDDGRPVACRIILQVTPKR